MLRATQRFTKVTLMLPPAAMPRRLFRCRYSLRKAVPLPALRSSLPRGARICASREVVEGYGRDEKFSCGQDAARAR